MTEDQYTVVKSKSFLSQAKGRELDALSNLGYGLRRYKLLGLREPDCVLRWRMRRLLKRNAKRKGWL